MKLIGGTGEIMVQLVAELSDLAEECAEITVEEIQAEIDAGSAGGEEYTYIADSSRMAWRRTPAERSQKGKRFRGSRPGEAPAQPTKKYRSSWHASAAGRMKNFITALAYSKAKTAEGKSLAEALEWGTPTIDPRPHIRQALIRARIRIAALVRRVA